MSSPDSTNKKTASSPEQSAAQNAQPPKKSDSDRRIAPEIAHELNNILTIIHGYSERLFFRHGNDPALGPQLKVISDAAKRATDIVRAATPSSGGGLPPRQKL